jgi:hypothetical protein
LGVAQLVIGMEVIANLLAHTAYAVSVAVLAVWSAVSQPDAVGLEVTTAPLTLAPSGRSTIVVAKPPPVSTVPAGHTAVACVGRGCPPGATAGAPAWMLIPAEKDARRQTTTAVKVKVAPLVLSSRAVHEVVLLG